MTRNRVWWACVAGVCCLVAPGRYGRCSETLEALKKRGRAAARAMPRIETRFTLGLWGTPGQTYGDRYADALDDVRRHYMNGICQVGAWRSDDTTDRYRQYMGEYVERAGKLGLHFFIHCQGLLPRKADQPWDYEATTRIVRERLLPFKDAEAVLGWYFCDEAPFNDAILERFLKLKLFLHKEAPACTPVVLLSPSGHPQEWVAQWSPYLNVMLTDLYGYSSQTDMLCVAIHELTERPHWITLDAFRYVPGPMPEIAWPRLKTYIALARGANGVNYYTYCGRSGFEGIGGWALVDAYGNARDGLWDKLGEMARVLEPVGHLVARTRVVRAPIRVACLKTVRTQRGSQQPEGLSWAVQIGVRRDPGTDTDFFICFNNDMRAPSTAKVEIYESYLGKRNVYDLFSLEEVSCPKRRHSTCFTIEPLDPGDGRIYALCSPSTFAGHKQAILKRRYENERVITELDLDWSRKTGLNTAPAQAALQQAGTQADARDFAAAGASVSNARRLLAEALEADTQVGAAYAHMRKAQQALGSCDRLLTYNVNTIWSLVARSAYKKERLNPLDPKVKPWISLVLKMSEAYRRLRRLEKRGHLRKLVAEAQFLAQTCAAMESGIRDILDGNTIPATYDKKRFGAMHDMCDRILPERFVQWNCGAHYKPYDPRKASVGDTSSVRAVNSWASYYRSRIFATEAQAKAFGLTPMK